MGSLVQDVEEILSLAQEIESAYVQNEWASDIALINARKIIKIIEEGDRT